MGYVRKREETGEGEKRQWRESRVERGAATFFFLQVRPISHGRNTSRRTVARASGELLGAPSAAASVIYIV